MGTLHEDQYTFLSCLAHLFLEREMFQTKFIEAINTHFIFNNTPPKSVPCMRKWKNGVQPDRSQTTLYYGACALHPG